VSLTLAGYWANKTEATIFLTLKTPWIDLFQHGCPDNLFVYYPENYHPDGDPKFFYKYLEHCYPSMVAVNRLSYFRA
jgi:hypothetical protein